MKKLVYGVGVNDADYVVQVKETVDCANGKRKQKQVWTCPFYKTWKSMLKRCYCEKAKINIPTYSGATCTGGVVTVFQLQTMDGETKLEGEGFR